MEKGEQREQINCLCLKFSLQKYFIGILYITLRIRIFLEINFFLKYHY